MSKVTIGHDSCTAWTCGDQQSFSFLNEVPFDNTETAVHTGIPVWPWATLVLPVYGLYAGAKAISKSIRSSR